MGAYVSTESCQAHYGVTPNCSVVLSDDNSTALLLGETTYGSFPGDPDIAGAGVLGAFFCVTVVSLLLAVVSSAWWSAKNIFGVKNRLTRKEKAIKNWQISIAGIIEALIVTCSDQQVFTGGAYAITLRYAKACSVSAYHYNIVANILLVTCATHLMAVTVARHYWQHPYVGVLRITVTTLVYVITGVLLSNQGSGSMGFPTEVPRLTDQYSLMLLPAACFQTGNFLLDNEVEKAFKAGSADAFFTGQIHGWPNYIIMFMFYLIAVGVSLGRVIRRGMGHDGKRKRFIARLKSTVPFLFQIKRFFYAIFGLYLLAGIALSAWTVGTATIYVLQLRRWVDKSGWIEMSHNRNPENDPSTFGQLVPLLLMSLTVFTFLQIVSERIHARRKRSKRLEYASLRRPRSRSDSQSDSQSPTRSSHTRYSTISVVDVGAATRTHDDVPGDGNQELYDAPYTDKHGKSSPVVGIRAVEAEDDEQPSPPVGVLRDESTAQPTRPRSDQVSEFEFEAGRHQLYDRDHADQYYHDRDSDAVSALTPSPEQQHQQRWSTAHPTPFTTEEGSASGSGSSTAVAGVTTLQRGSASPSSSPAPSKPRRVGLFELARRTREDKKRRKRLLERGAQGGDSQSMTDLRGGFGGGEVYDGTGGERSGVRYSAVSLPVGVGAGFEASTGGGSRPASGQYFVQGQGQEHGMGRHSLGTPPVGGYGDIQMQTPMQERDIGLGVGVVEEAGTLMYSGIWTGDEAGGGNGVYEEEARQRGGWARTV